MKIEIDFKSLLEYDFIYEEDAIGYPFRLLDKNGDVLAGGDSVSACINKFFSEFVMQKIRSRREEG